MPRGDLATKLLLKPGHLVHFIALPTGAIERLEPLPEGAAVVDDPDSADLILAFVGTAAALAESASPLAEAANRGAIVWVSYPKKSSGVATDMSRDAGWEPLLEAGLRPVTQVSLDKTWSALRFRPTGAVGKEFGRR